MSYRRLAGGRVLACTAQLVKNPALSEHSRTKQINAIISTLAADAIFAPPVQERPAEKSAEPQEESQAETEVSVDSIDAPVNQPPSPVERSAYRLYEQEMSAYGAVAKSEEAWKKEETEDDYTHASIYDQSKFQWALYWVLGFVVGCSVLLCLPCHFYRPTQTLGGEGVCCWNPLLSCTSKDPSRSSLWPINAIVIVAVAIPTYIRLKAVGMLWWVPGN